MRALLFAFVCVSSLSFGACGGPILSGAPKPDPDIVAAAAAAAASAATLADPDSAAKHQEQKKDSDEHRPKDVKVDQNVPPDVLDRLDKAEAGAAGRPGEARDGGVDGGARPK